ncbi:MAG TPA: VOC family protein [Thermoanaerobaculia bacterium]|jgi:catechol 2,3-dioxygenase-like lactoylglutathione lyase family enzyme
MFENVTPIFYVRDLPTSIDYYVRILGFTIVFHEPGIIASVARDGCQLFLTEGDQGHPGTWVWIGVDDVEPLYADYVARGAKVRHPPTNYLWAFEMQIEDPDGHVLRIGSEPKDGRPIGPWLDMHGTLWEHTGEGWRRVVVPPGEPGSQPG